MGYDITLNNPVDNTVIEFDSPHMIRGGTYATNGTKEAWLKVTYNYAPIFYRADILGEGGIRKLYGMTGAQSIPLLKGAIANLKDDVSDDYWEQTEGNAKKALCGLLAFAEMRPDGVWRGD